MAKDDLMPLPSILKQNPPPITCSDCQQSKMRPKPHQRTTRNYEVAQSISSDIRGPISPMSTQGNRYFVTFLDTHSRYLTVFFLPNRKQIPEFTSKMTQMVKKKHGHRPQLLRTDNAKEYQSSTMNNLLNHHGIVYSSTIPYSPQQNSLAERINSTLVAAARSNLSHSNLPDTYWEQAIRDAVFKYNITMHTTTKQLPYTMWHGHPPSISAIFAFGQFGCHSVAPN